MPCRRALTPHGPHGCLLTAVDAGHRRAVAGAAAGRLALCAAAVHDPCARPGSAAGAAAVPDWQDGDVLAASHVLAGATAGLLLRGPGRRAGGALGAHVALDFIGHDDHTVRPPLQAVLGLAALGAVAAGHGLRSAPVIYGLVGAAPDAEVAVGLAVGRANGPFIFPSHWQVGPRRGSHPVRLPGGGVPIRVEIALTAVGTLLLALSGPRLRSRLSR